jgi:hypothetical protein
MFALTTVFILFSFFEEWERLSNSRSTHSARAAFYFRNTVRVFANQFTFRFGALGFVTFPVTFGFFTNWFTFRFGSLAVSNAVGLFADSNTFRAVKHFASFIRALDLTFRFFTFYIANCVFRFSTASVAFWRFTDWVANSRTMRIVTFP